MIISELHRNIIPNPDEDDENVIENGTPVGNAVLPLLLMAAVLYLLHKRKQTR